jgi:hypothetical protein
MKVVMYKSNDGTLHESVSSCNAHNAALSVMPALRSSLLANAQFADDDGEVIAADQVCDWAYKNAIELTAILLPLIPPKSRVSRKSKEKQMPDEVATGESVTA